MFRYPCFRNDATRAPPMKPPPPVTSTKSFVLGMKKGSPQVSMLLLLYRGTARFCQLFPLEFRLNCARAGKIYFRLQSLAYQRHRRIGQCQKVAIQCPATTGKIRAEG